MTIEVWKEIKDFENYQVSNLGRVKNARGKIMKQKTQYNGYKNVGLRKGGNKQKMFLVHRLVATAFIGVDENNPQVNHIDGNKENNNVSNLEWCTASENKKHAVATGLQEIDVDQLKENAIKRRKPIRVINKVLNIDETYDSIAEASKHVECNEKTLRNVLKGKHKSRLGYEVTYV